MSDTTRHPHADAVANRLSRIEGHVRGIKKMVVEQKPCDQILVQISAVRAALNEVSKIVLDDHMHTCILQDMREGRTESYEKLRVALDQYMK